MRLPGDPKTLAALVAGKGKKPARRSKYNVSKPAARTFDGKVYASKAEMLYAKMLAEELLAGDGHILDVIEQPRVSLGCRENVYVPDFLIVPISGRPYFVDVKGMETPAFKKNVNLWRRYGRLPLHIVTRAGSKWNTRIVEAS